MEVMTIENTHIQYPPAKEIILMLLHSLTEGNADINIIETQTLTIFEVRVPKEHVGKIIGKGGSIAFALRRVLASYSGRDNRCYRLEVV